MEPAAGRPSLTVLAALDSARTQMYHLKAIAVAGMGFFTGAYDLFCISTVSRLLGRLYFQGEKYELPDRPSRQPMGVDDTVVGVALVGTFMGQLAFGYLGDRLGRKRVYGITLVLMAACALGSGLSFGSSRRAVVSTLCFFRFWLGVGVGGEHPLSATIMCEYANRKARGAFMAAVFAMQGVGIVFACLVSMIVSAVFLRYNPAPSWGEDPQRSAQLPAADYVWRVVLMFAAFPALATLYWRMKLPETARYTALVAGDGKQAAMDMQAVLDVPIEGEQEKVSRYKAANEYPLLSREFARHLAGTTTTWFVLQITFYSQNLTQKDVFQAIRLTRSPANTNALEEMFQISRAMFLVALLGTFPGYWVAVAIIDKIGRRLIQLLGFLMMSVFLLAMGLMPPRNDDSNVLFALLYALTLFFASLGPNCTTFVLAAELFPARLRSTCHAISAAAGTAGAITTAYGVQNLNTLGYIVTIKKGLVMLAVTNFLGFFLTFLIPETMGQSLEEISGEDDNASIGAASLVDMSVDENSPV
ncbi:inorganic phosphate transporter 1-11-like [Panicum virgatum]|uniref:H(+)/Pi cotransporter n=1 Tax=Panicum virgatum TaxID=38727 RepID=A0A8T0MCL8_PANVG|nr:inorganic phosphate transporter 1-11-like [Panicum virgatum]KAG2534677.1 hypothetical protein PVAP13_9NG075702 [Panicum virgatum]